MAAHITIAVPTDVGQIWTLTDDNGETFQSSYGPARIRNTAPGDYSISWSTVDGYDPPVPSSEGPITITEGQTYVFTSPTYSVTAASGTVGVDCTGFESAAWSIEPGSYSGTGTTAGFSVPAPNGYTITWQDTVAGFDPPPPPTVETCDPELQ